jgi:hypothetical protein
MAPKSLSRLALVVLAALLLALAGCGGGGSAGIVEPPDSDPVAGKIKVRLLRTTSGAPAGVQISWTRVDDPEVSGYYIYRDTVAIPAGDPTPHVAKRVNGGDIIDQSGSGTETLTFNDAFSPNFGDQFFYRMTVANQTDDESDFSNQVSITIAEHTIDSLSPLTGSIGDTITITGEHFGATRGGDTVKFTNAAGDTEVLAAAGDYVSWSDTEIEVKIPYGAADGPLAVTVDGAEVFSDDNLDYNEPAITNLNPTEDWVANGYVIITGTDFGPAPSSGGSDTEVFFGSTPAQASDFDESAWSTTQIKVKVPAAATGMTVPVTVDVAGNVSAGSNFTILPHIDSLSVSSGVTGTSVTLTGTNFGATQSTGSVRVKGVLATVSSWNNTSVTITIPGGATDGNVVLTRSDNKVSNGIGFDVVPTFTGFSPSRRVVGEQLTINGTGFGSTRGTGVVRWLNGNIDGTSYISWTPTQIIVVVPTGAKTGQLRVMIDDNNVGSNQDSADSSGSLKVVLPPPVIDDTGQL